MGYHTSYTLKIYCSEGNVNEESDLELIKQLRESCKEAEWVLNSIGEDNGADDNRWYEHERDMREFSAQYPDFIFALSGKGEEFGDLWTKYFFAGKCQVAKARIHTDAFDLKKLT